MQNWNDIIAYYRDQGAPQDQQMLIAMVREVQEACGGTLTAQALAHIAQTVPAFFVLCFGAVIPWYHRQTRSHKNTWPQALPRFFPSLQQ